MKKLKIAALFFLVWGFVSAYEVRGQTAYGISIAHVNQGSRTIEGYSGTWLDYYAGIYYDPEVIGDIYRTDDSETSLAWGRHIGYADILPAEVYMATNNYVEGKSYCTYSQHYVWSYYYTGGYSNWFDPFRYSFFSPGYPPWPGSPFGNYWVIPRRHRLGSTEACVTVPYPPTPTPTPMPTATPTPLPCDPLLGESCQEQEQIVMQRIRPVRPTNTSGVSGGGNTTEVAICVVPARPNVAANLQLVRRPEHVNSGGHIGAAHTGLRPIGKLARTSGVSGSDGCFRTTYSSSHISGYVGVDGTMSGSQPIGEDILIRVDGLFELGPGDDHVLVHNDVAHPAYHFGTGVSNISHRNIASDYRQEFYGTGPIPEADKIHYNDMGLALGGKFDLPPRGQPKPNWLNTGSHAEHREGINTDTRSRNIPTNRWIQLNRIFFDNGSTRTKDETTTGSPHWHLRFEYGVVRSAERTPHSYIEDAFSAAIGNESEQSGYETWLSRLTLAKASGQEQLLSEAKALQLGIFVSSEYGPSMKTNTQFVTDVLTSHLLREPSQAEIDYWVSFMNGRPPSESKAKRQRRVLTEIQSLPEFSQVVLSLVDPTLSQ